MFPCSYHDFVFYINVLSCDCDQLTGYIQIRTRFSKSLFFCDFKQYFFLFSQIYNLRIQKWVRFVSSLHSISRGSLPDGWRVHCQCAHSHLASQCELSAGVRKGQRGGGESSSCGPSFLSAVPLGAQGECHMRKMVSAF